MGCNGKRMETRRIPPFLREGFEDMKLAKPGSVIETRHADGQESPDEVQYRHISPFSCGWTEKCYSLAGMIDRGWLPVKEGCGK